MDIYALDATHQKHLSCEVVRAFFRTSPYPHLADYVSAVRETEVLLEGVSTSFHSKQLAQNVALRCPGVTCVRNLIKVNYPS